MDKGIRKQIYEKVTFWYAIVCCIAGVVLFWWPGTYYTKWAGLAFALISVSFWTALYAKSMRHEICTEQKKKQKQIMIIVIVADVIHVLFSYLNICIASA